jgi:Protein of unknown function (DUF4199)
MKIAIKWGVILGVSVCLWTLAIHAMGFYTTRIAAGQRADVVALILPILAIVLALLERRRVTGVLTLGQAVGTGLVVGLVSIPITAGFLWYYHHSINPRWVDYLVDHERTQMTAAGASADAIAKAEAAQRGNATDQAQFGGAIVGTAIISLVIAFVAGLALRRSRPIA